MTEGYSDTPLAKKLNLRDGQRVWFDGMPQSIQDEIGEYALDLTMLGSPCDEVDAAHIFVTCQASLTSKLADLQTQIARDGQIWVSWPKKGSGIDTEVDEQAVREAGLSLGLVDTKKCALDDVWSGLKFVIRKEDR